MLIEIVLEILLYRGSRKLAQRRVLIWEGTAFFLEIFEILWEQLLLLLNRSICIHGDNLLIRAVSLEPIICFLLMQLIIFPAILEIATLIIRVFI